MLSSYYPDRVAFFSIPNQVIYFIVVLVTLLVPVLMPKVVQAINQFFLCSIYYFLHCLLFAILW